MSAPAHHSAATAAVESAYLIQTGAHHSAIDLAEQELISCVYLTEWLGTTGEVFLSAGCGGGFAHEAINWVANKNLTTEARWAPASTCKEEYLQPHTTLWCALAGGNVVLARRPRCQSCAAVHHRSLSPHKLSTQSAAAAKRWAQ